MQLILVAINLAGYYESSHTNRNLHFGFNMRW